MVAALIVVRRMLDPDGLSDLEIADELIRRRAEIDRLEAEFAQLAWVGPPAGDRRGGRFAVDPGVAAASHRDA